MNDIAIRVVNLSKQYRIGGPQARYKTIRESIADFGFRIWNFTIRNSTFEIRSSTPN